MKRIKEASWRILTQAISEDKENQEDVPENQEDSDANELPETSFQVLSIILHKYQDFMLLV